MQVIKAPSWKNKFKNLGSDLAMTELHFLFKKNLVWLTRAIVKSWTKTSDENYVEWIQSNINKCLSPISFHYLINVQLYIQYLGLVNSPDEHHGEVQPAATAPLPWIREQPRWAPCRSRWQSGRSELGRCTAQAEINSFLMSSDYEE